MWNRFARFSFDKFIQNLTGYAATYNGEWWFIRAFIAAILLGTIYYYLTEKIHIVYVETGLVCLFQWLQSSFCQLWSNWIHLVAWLLVTCGHSCLCQIPLFVHICLESSLENMISSQVFAASLVAIVLFNRALIGLMLIVSAFYFQEKVFSNLSDMMLIITPVFMTGCILLLDLCKPLCKVMQFFGGLSTNMWLTHTFFCYYFYPFAIVVFGQETRSWHT